MSKQHKTTETVSAGMLYRSVEIDRAGMKDDLRTVELAFSSEAPVERWFGDEILDHAPESVRLGRMQSGAAVLVDHDQRDQVGVVESVSIDPDRRGRAVVRFGLSDRASEIYQDVKDGIRRHVSVGYRIYSAIAEKVGEATDEKFRVTDWEPMEVSIVAVPADPSVGIARSDDRGTYQFKVTRAETMSDDKPTETTEQATKPDPKTIDVRAIESDARAKEQARIRAITKTGAKYGNPQLAEQFVENGRSVSEFNEALLNAMDRAESPPKRDHMPEVPNTDLGMGRKEVQQYSLMRAINALASGDWKKAGFERECSIAIAERVGRDPKGLFVPGDWQKRAAPMDAATTGEGLELIGTDHLAGSFIEYLYANSVAIDAGAQVIQGLVGNVDIPAQTGAATFGWVAEDAAQADSLVATGQVALSPKTINGAVPMTRKLMQQSSPGVEMVVRNALARGAALAIDLGALSGTGADDQPTGITVANGVGTSTIASAGSPTWIEIVEFETDVDTANALGGSLRYVTTPAVVGAMKTTKKDAGSGIFIMENNEVNGYPVSRTSQLAANTIIFGNFADLMIGFWGVLDIVVDTATKASTGGVVLRAFQDCDIGLGHAASFSKNA